jgi:hypothetical protein
MNQVAGGKNKSVPKIMISIVELKPCIKFEKTIPS